MYGEERKLGGLESEEGCGGLGHIYADDEQADGDGRCYGEHSARGYAVAYGSTDETADKHKQPVYTGHAAGDSGGCQGVGADSGAVLDVLQCPVGDADFDAYVAEYRDDAEGEIAVAESACGTDAFAFFAGYMGFGQTADIKYDEGYGKDAHSEVEYGVGCRDGAGGAAQKATYNDRGKCGTDAVACAAELNELVALVLVLAQRVKHGIDHSVEHTHGESGNESAYDVY